MTSSPDSSSPRNTRTRTSRTFGHRRRRHLALPAQIGIAVGVVELEVALRPGRASGKGSASTSAMRPRASSVASVTRWSRAMRSMLRTCRPSRLTSASPSTATATSTSRSVKPPEASGAPHHASQRDESHAARAIPGFVVVPIAVAVAAVVVTDPDPARARRSDPRRASAPSTARSPSSRRRRSVRASEPPADRPSRRARTARTRCPR